MSLWLILVTLPASFFRILCYVFLTSVWARYMKNRITRTEPNPDEVISDIDTKDEFGDNDSCNSSIITNRPQSEILNLSSVTCEKNEKSSEDKFYSESSINKQNISVANCFGDKTKQISSDDPICASARKTLTIPLPQKLVASTDNLIVNRHSSSIHTKDINSKYSETDNTTNDGEWESCDNITDEECGDKIADEGYGDKIANEGSSDKIANEGSSGKIANEGSGDEIANEGSGDEIANEGSGDEIADKGPGDEIANEGPGDEIAHEGPGDKIANEGSGDKIANEGSGDKIADKESGDKIAKEGFGDKITERKLESKTTDDLLVTNVESKCKISDDEDYYDAKNVIEELSNTSNCSILPETLISSQIDVGQCMFAKYFVDKITKIEGVENSCSNNLDIDEVKSSQISEEFHISTTNEKAECSHEIIDDISVITHENLGDCIPNELKPDVCEMNDSYKFSLDIIPMEFIYPCLPHFMHNC